MKRVIVEIEEYLYDFYQRVGENAGGISTERVIADALLKLAGELSLNAMSEKNLSETRKAYDN